jgi:PiT family inorganic phosphate transporter
MESSHVLLIVGIILALVFDFTNGFNDAASLVATMVASRAMRPRPALFLAAFFECLGPLVVGTAVASTIGGIVRPGTGADLLPVVVVALVSAIAWNAFAARVGMPSSSSHALLGSLIGATLVSTGRLGSVNWGWTEFDPTRPTGVLGVVIALLISPVCGFAGGYYLQRISMRLLRGARPSVNRRLRRLQVVAAAGLAFSHGANDAQKVMGVITLLLVSSGMIATFAVPLWVKLAAAIALAGGVVSGGRRIMRTIGSGIFRVRPVHGLSSQIASTAVILGNALVGGPVSTTHVVSSTIMGVGASHRRRAVRWGKVHEILITWVLTIPSTMIVSAMLFVAFRAVFE